MCILRCKKSREKRGMVCVRRLYAHCFSVKLKVHKPRVLCLPTIHIPASSWHQQQLAAANTEQSAIEVLVQFFEMHLQRHSKCLVDALLDTTYTRRRLEHALYTRS